MSDPLGPAGATRSNTRDDDPGAASRRSPMGFLAVAAAYDRPLEPPDLLIPIAPHERVEIGRGATTTVSTDGDVVHLTLADEWCSTRHAVVTGSRVEDQGSRNGLFVNGARLAAAELRDGDLLEIGHTLVAYAAPDVPDAMQLVELARELRGTAAGSLSLSFLAQADRARRVADSELPVLITGETGVGKEVLSRTIHGWAGRAGAFVAINCAAIPVGLAESELFGHRRGAFTGAASDRVGVLEAADGGTLLLDEVDALPPEVQPKLLRFLQDRRIRRVGETAERTLDVRILAATNRDLSDAVDERLFRGDLYARLRGLVVRLPPLRERRADLGLLVARLLQRHAGRREGHPELTLQAWRVLTRRRWPQNVRELERCLEAALLLAPAGQPIDADHVAEPDGFGVEEPPAPESRPPALPPRRRRDPAKTRERLVDALTRHDGNLAAVARELGVSRMQIYRWLERFELDAATFKPG